MQVEQLSAGYGHLDVLRGIDLSAAPGAVTMVLGPNAAGKTTLLRILACLGRPTGGRLRVAGLDPLIQPAAVRAAVGLVAHRPLLYPDLTAAENLRFFARLYGVSDVDGAVEVALRATGMWARRQDRVRVLSRGLQQRSAIARAVLHGPQVLLLDEPHTGLDPSSADALDATLRRLAANGQTVLLTSHNLPRASGLADWLVLLARGRVAWQGPPQAVGPDGLAQLYRRLTGDEAAALTEVGAGWGAPGSSPQESRAGPDRAGDQPPASWALGPTGPAHPPGPGPSSSPPTGAPVPALVVAPDQLRPTEDHGRPVPADAKGTSADAKLVSTGQELAPAAPGLAAAIQAVLWKDLVVEWRAREIVPPVLVFALVTLVVFHFTMATEPRLEPLVAPGALWVALVFGSMLGLARLVGGEVDTGCLTGLQASPADRGGLFLGKWLAGYVFSLLLAAVLLPAFAVLLNLPLGALPGLAGVVALGLVGWQAAGTLMGTLAVTARAREVLLPVLLFPVVLPLLIAAVQASSGILTGLPLADYAPALALVGGYGIIFLVLGFLLYPVILESVS